MIKVIRENPVPKGKVICSNCGSKLEYGNVDLHEVYDNPSFASYTTEQLYKKYTISCPVCGCNTPASWIQRKEKMNMCHECKWFSYDVMGACICTREDGNRKTSPYVVACIDNFERKEAEK